MARLVADIQLRLMSIFTTKNRRQEFTPRCLSLDDVMPPKMSSSPLQKFRPHAGTKVNCDVNGACSAHGLTFLSEIRPCVHMVNNTVLSNFGFNLFVLKFTSCSAMII